MAKKHPHDNSETETTSAAGTSAEPAPAPETHRPIALPAVGAEIDAALAADVEQDIVDEGGYGRRTTIALQLLRADQTKIESTLARYLAEVHDPDAQAELAKLAAYLHDRFGAIETLASQHHASTSGAVHFSDEAWAATRAGAPVAETVRKVALKRLKDQPALREQFSPGLELDASPQGLFDAVDKMLVALALPEKQELYRQKRIRAALLVTQLTTVHVRLKAALAAGVAARRTGELSAALDAALLQLHTAAVRIESEFDQVQRSDLAEGFDGLIPRRHGGRRSDRKGSGTKPKTGGEPPPVDGQDQKPAAGGSDGSSAPPQSAPETPAGDGAPKPPTEG